MSSQACISVDVEMAAHTQPQDLRRQVQSVLDLFEHMDIVATFFICGDLVHANAALIHQIARKHEVAAHGYRHINLRALPQPQLEREIARAAQSFRSIDLACVGFRCPLLIVPDHLGAILSNHDFLYDSSLVASPLTAHRALYPFSRPSVEGIIEIPIQTFGRWKFPLALSSLRLMGKTKFLSSLPATVRHFYFHTWEIDSDALPSSRLPYRSKLLTELRGYLHQSRRLVRGLPTMPADLTGLNTGPAAITLLADCFSAIRERGTHFVTCETWARERRSS
jgi:hypothetical protein